MKKVISIIMAALMSAASSAQVKVSHASVNPEMSKLFEELTQLGRAPMVQKTGGMGYGWSKIEINNIIVRDGKLTYGVTCDKDFTGRQFTGRWLSAVDFVLERTGDLP